jgi:hypothetical protein
VDQTTNLRDEFFVGFVQFVVFSDGSLIEVFESLVLVHQLPVDLVGVEVEFAQRVRAESRGAARREGSRGGRVLDHGIRQRRRMLLAKSYKKITRGEREDQHKGGDKKS